MKAPVALFTGGVRSGKSMLAERWVMSMRPNRLYVATCLPRDEEMTRRVALHQSRRDSSWECLEAPLDPAVAINARLANGFDGAILLDSLGMWVANLLDLGRDGREIAALGRELVDNLARQGSPAALVSEECGLGFLPPNKTARAFGDALGEINQYAAAICDTVVFACCGLPLPLKGAMREI